MVFRVGLQEESLTDEFPMLMQRHVLFGGQGEALQQSFGAPTASGSSGGGAVGQPKQRARRGQATDPHSIAERLRRERIAEGMKSLHELVPNANKTDKASMLDEIINYVKFLQLQVKEKSGNGTNTSSSSSSSSNEGMTVTERQVVKLMEEDMGSAMQYLQGKGLCLMPIPLASTISAATSHLATTDPITTNPLPNGGCISPTISVLTVQSATKDTSKLE